jgi:hypothetical protein
VAVQFLRLLWRRRALVLGVPLCVATVVAVLLYVWPRKLRATFVYERPLTESEYNVLVRRFRSSENLDKLQEQLVARGLTEYAQKLAATRLQQPLESLVRFSVSPEYPKRLLTTDPATSERISNFKAQLLEIEIVGDADQDLAAIAAVVTDNFEDVLPMYEIRNDLKDLVQEYKSRAAQIEDNRFSLSLELQKEEARLEKLRGLEETPQEAVDAGVLLQFTDIGNSRHFLPLSYQVRAVQAKIIELQQTLANDERLYTYYLQILDVGQELLDSVEKSLLTYYTVGEFFGLLDDKLAACTDAAVEDFLRAYKRKTENLVLVNTRAGESPVVHRVSKQIVTRAVLAFVVSLMVATFGAVLLEYRREKSASV